MTERVEISAVWLPQDQTLVGPLLVEWAPMFEAYWRKARPEGYPDYGFNEEQFVRGWPARALVPVIARVDGRPVGFLILYMSGNLFCDVRNVYMSHVYAEPGMSHLKLPTLTKNYLMQLFATLNVDFAYNDGRRGMTLFYKKGGR